MGIKVIEFNADWCSPCKSYAKILEELKGIYPDIDIITYNVDDHDDLVSKYAVRNIPFTIIEQNDEIKFKKAGIISLFDLKTEINKLIM